MLLSRRAASRFTLRRAAIPTRGCARFQAPKCSPVAHGLLFEARCRRSLCILRVGDHAFVSGSRCPAPAAFRRCLTFLLSASEQLRFSALPSVLVRVPASQRRANRGNLVLARCPHSLVLARGLLFEARSPLLFEHPARRDQHRRLPLVLPGRRASPLYRSTVARSLLFEVSAVVRSRCSPLVVVARHRTAGNSPALRSLSDRGA